MRGEIVYNHEWAFRTHAVQLVIARRKQDHYDASLTVKVYDGNKKHTFTYKDITQEYMLSLVETWEKGN